MMTMMMVSTYLSASSTLLAGWADWKETATTEPTTLSNFTFGDNFIWETTEQQQQQQKNRSQWSSS